jgi:hypothetical protein
MVYRQPSLIRQLCLKILALILTGLQPGVRQRKNERNRFNGLLPSFLTKTHAADGFPTTVGKRNRFKRFLQ